jgi:hypothetical protein
MSENVKDCRWPWNRLYIHVNGDIKPCCYATAPVGNVYDGKDLDKLWAGEEMTELRQYLVENRIHRVCAGSGCAYVKSAMPVGRDLEQQERYRVGELPGISEHTRTLARLGQGHALMQVYHELPAVGGPLSRSTRLAWQQMKTLLRRLKWANRARLAGDDMAPYRMALDLRAAGFWIADKFALHFARVAAKSGYGPAYLLIGEMIAEGRGQARDLVEAKEMFRKAAERDEPKGFLLHGQLLRREGQTVEAVRLIKIAERRGVAGASEALLEMG